jgi:low affinity Fe/Cu permease
MFRCGRIVHKEPKVAESKRTLFDRLAQWSAKATGRPSTFMLAVLVVVLWAVSGPLFGFSDTWQLVINTGTTIVTFLMVFLIQSTQNRDTIAIQVKLDELIRAVEGAHNAVIDLENQSEEELVEMQEHYRQLAQKTRDTLECGGSDVDCPELEEIATKAAEKTLAAANQQRQAS